jgi:hypothetical protein
MKKFSTIDNVGEITRFAKNGWNRLDGGGPTDRGNSTSITFLAITYLTLLYLPSAFLFSLLIVYSKNVSTDLDARWLERRDLL